MVGDRSIATGAASSGLPECAFRCGSACQLLKDCIVQQSNSTPVGSDPSSKPRLPLVLAIKENRNSSMPHDILCIAAHYDSTQASPSMGTAHNEIRRPFFRGVDNQLACRSSHSLLEPGFRSQSFFVGEGLGVRQDTASSLAQLRGECFKGGAYVRWCF